MIFTELLILNANNPSYPLWGYCGTKCFFRQTCKI